ncbi:MetQ/NlpA family ABC transporter substrate-binding protein [Swingsia samuiensis]|uniref:Lipoprotein n=1 Tax=Swingsia samuiensis TaxID=1293412 RepID=A0A4Y6UK43_9PROT|nr:MetQ/NlpA family ABC transporter substrate-binding protein [Swingsia samuiensis]QDH16846.1 MetQ/NlpA family ABC transporter substrate-binding protein [Swingsia samuiensis]
MAFSSPSSRRHFLTLLGGGVVGLSLIKPAFADTPTTLKIGIMSGEDEDIWKVVSQNAAKRGLNLQIVTFSDYNAPDEALAEHELNANAFQHGPFLKAQLAAHSNFHIVPVGNTYVSPIGLYSKKWHSIKELPQNATIGVPNDPSNEGRALKLLETLGVIKVSPDAGLTPTALDITDNPKNITIRELDAGVVGRTLPDLDAAIVNTDWAIKSGIDIKKEKIAQESMTNNPYACFISVNQEDEHAPWVKPLVESYQQPNVRQALLDVYHGANVPAWQ